MEQPDKNLEQTLENWRRDRASLEEIRALAADLGNQHFLHGIPALVQLLDHQDEIVRCNAATSLAFEFHHMPIVEKLLTMLAEDADEDCRDAAAGGLATLCQDSKEPRVLVALARAALIDPDEYVRSFAYKALLRVNGLSREEHLRVLRDENLLIDQDRVKTILAEIRA